MTRLSRFPASAAITAVLTVPGCGDREITSLEGEITCGSLTCGDGQLCRMFEPHPGETLQYSCETVPDRCEVFDCVSEDRGCNSDCKEICPACITTLCGWLFSVHERELSCLGF